MEERQYPRGIAAMSRDYGRGVGRDLTVWMEDGFTPGKVFKIEHYAREAEAVVTVLTDAGTYWFNNWNNSQGGEPSKWDEIDRFPVPTEADADRLMTRYAVEHWNVREINGMAVTGA